jgi:hypothetical protein
MVQLVQLFQFFHLFQLGLQQDQRVQLTQSGRKTQLVLRLVLEYLVVQYFLEFLEYLVVRLTHSTQYFLVILFFPFYLVVLLVLEYLVDLVVQLYLLDLQYLVVQIHLHHLEHLEHLVVQ